MKKLILILSLALPVLAGCRKDDVPDSGSYAGLGRIRLSLSAENRLSANNDAEETGMATPRIEEVDFEISGYTEEGAEIREKIYFKENGDVASAEFRAGTYTITATYSPDNAKEGNGFACYRGVSQTFKVAPAGEAYVIDDPDTPISIHMTPSNARVKIIFDVSLKTFYQNVSVDFTSPREQSVRYSDADSLGICTVYLEAGKVGAYGINAQPLECSGAHKVEITGLYLPVIIPDADPVFLEAGKEYTVRVKFAPGGVAVFLDDESAPVYTTEETWDGLFS